MTTSSTLWMGDLEPYMDETFLSNAFNSLGITVMSVKLIRNRQTGLLAGYCFVDFPDTECAHQAMLKLNGKPLPGSTPPKRFKLNIASHGKNHLTSPEHSIFVGDLSEEVDDYALYQAFISRYPTCRAAKVVLDGEGKSRGYGFVRFGTEEEQQKALLEMHLRPGIGKNIIRVSVATPKAKTADETTSSSSIASAAAAIYTAAQYQQYYNYAYGYGTYGSEYYGYSADGTPASEADYAAYQQQAAEYAQAYEQQAQQQQAYEYQYQQYAAAGAPAVSEDETPEEPNVELHLNAENASFMRRSEDLYTSLEASRWQPLDNGALPTASADVTASA